MSKKAIPVCTDLLKIALLERDIKIEQLQDTVNTMYTVLTFLLPFLEKRLPQLGCNDTMQELIEFLKGDLNKKGDESK